MDRNLDGIYFRVERNGKYVNVCFSDLSEHEMNKVMENKSIIWVKELCIELGKTIKYLGDTFDLRRE